LKDPIPFPQKLVSLTAKNNDGLLANHIAKAENILRICKPSIRSAELEKNFRRKWYYKLENIGELHLNADNNLVFKPADQTNFDDGFGLTSLFPLVKEPL
jgi:hypothetical protein